MFPIGGFVIICLVFLMLYMIGLLNFLSDFEEDKCEMTYMFEYPQFVKVSHDLDERFPKYGLYAYSEGRLTSKVRSMYFNGIPILFIPGNGGSYKQVRSLSSVALRKALHSGSPYSFDYFAVDLNNELSGLYGPLLYDQLEYVNSSLNRILELYRSKKPNSIIVIGHSMGGVIANKLIAESKTDLISILITLAAPLKRAPVIFDYHIYNFYNDYRKMENNNTVVVSLSGGYSDFLVPPHLSDIKGHNRLHAVTTNIPRSWLESDHVQIVWCKQTVLAINRALFDSIDVKTKQVSKNHTYLNQVFEHHLVRHNGIKPYKLENYDKQIAINYKGEWIEHLSKQYSIEFLHGLKQTNWYMLKLTSLPAHQMLSVLAINVETVNWIFACNANLPKGKSKVCTEAIHLTHLSEISPSVKYKRRYLQIDMHELKKNYSDLTHVVIRALPTNEPIVFHVDVYNSAERQIEVNLPRWWSFQKTVILEETVRNAVYYQLVIKQLQHVLQFYQLFVEPINCQVQNRHVSATLIAPWGNQNQHAYFTNVEKKPLDIRLFTSQPLSESNSSATVRLILEPTCTYRISIRSNIFGTLGQMARFYTPLLLPNIAAIVLLSLRYQLKTSKSGHFPILFAALREGVKPYHIIPFVKISSWLTSRIDMLPKTETYVAEDGLDFFALPMLLFFTSIGIVFVLSVIYYISLVTLDSTINKLSLKLTRIFFSIGWSDYLVTSVLEKAPFIAAGALILTSFSTCGGVALCLGVIFYFLKLSHMSQDYIEKVVWFTIKKFAKECKSFIRKKSKKSEKHNEIQDVTDLTTDSNSDESVIKELADNTVKDNIENKQDLTGKDKENHDGETLKKGNTKISKDESKCTDEVKRDLEEDVEDIQEQENEIEKLEPKINEIGNSEEIKEENDKSETPQTALKADDELATTRSSIFFHSTLFFIWCIITVINLPATLTWAHNFKFSKSLTPDDSFIPGFVLSCCALPLWQCDLPKVNKKWVTVLEMFVSATAVLGLTYASISIYILNYLLTLLVLVITLHQLFAPENAAEGEPLEGAETKSKYDGTKLKLN